MTVFCNKKLEIIIRGICHFSLLVRTTEKKTKREALPTRKPLPAPSAPTEPAGRTPWKNFCRTQRQGCQIKDRMPS